MPPQDVRVGDLVVNYEILEKCGESHISDVWKGKHKQNGSLVAIKILKSQWVQAGQNQLLEEEGKILCNLSNDHIVRCLQQSMRGTSPILVIKYVSENSLKRIIEQSINDNSKLRSMQIVKYLVQIEDALNYIHSQGIIHCDVKPEHFLLDEHENIVLCDFGHAVQLSPEENQKPLQLPLKGYARNPKYMAPEQKEQNGGYHCCASDQYALGIVVCELLCGKFLEEVPQNQEEWMRLGLPSMAITGIMAKALAQDPKARYPDIKTFTQALSDELKNVPGNSNAFAVPGKSAPASQQHALPGDNNHNLSAPGNQQSSDLDSSSTPSPVQQRGVWKVVLSRRTFFALMDVATFGVLGYSWTKLEPKIADIFVPPANVVRSVSPQQFGAISIIYHGHINNVNGVVWLPAPTKADNPQIASASYDGTVQVWDAITGTNISNFKGHQGQVYDVAWSSMNPPNIASCSDIIIVSNIKYGAFTTKVGSHSQQINAIAWSPDGQKIVSASYDHTAIVWDAINPGNLTTHHQENKVYDVTWSPNGKYIASCSEGKVDVWYAAEGDRKRIEPYIGHSGATVLSVSWFPTLSKKFGDLIASGDANGYVRIWSTANGQNYLGHDDVDLTKYWNTAVRRVAWSLNGKYLAAGTHDGKVHVWIAETGIEVTGSPYDGNNSTQDIFGILKGAKPSVNALAWSQDGTKIAAGYNDGSVRVFSSGLTDAGNS